MWGIATIAMEEITDSEDVVQVDKEYEYVTEVSGYSHFDQETVNVTVADVTHGTACMMEDMRELGFTLQNVDTEHNRFTFKKDL